jgi:hypothetical protein
LLSYWAAELPASFGGRCLVGFPVTSCRFASLRSCVNARNYLKSPSAATLIRKSHRQPQDFVEAQQLHWYLLDIAQITNQAPDTFQRIRKVGWEPDTISTPETILDSKTPILAAIVRDRVSQNGSEGDSRKRPIAKILPRSQPQQFIVFKCQS